MKKLRLNKLKKSKVTVLVLLVLTGIFVFSCAQDSIFYDISIEPKPKDTLIPGSPTNIVAAGNRVFVGTRMSGIIYSYNGSSWGSFSVPGGSLGDLATDGKDLYVLIFPGGNPQGAPVIRRYIIEAASWDIDLSIEGYYIQSIYGVDSYIFAGAQNKSNHQQFAVLCYDVSNGMLNIVLDQTSILKGAAKYPDGTIFLATLGSGIFRYNAGIVNGPISGTSRANLMGIIETGGVLVAVGSSGSIYSGNASGFKSISVGVNFTGAMCLWLDPRDQWKPSLLLLGVRGSGTSRNHGYREVLLQNGLPNFEIRTPGEESITSVRDGTKYSASIGIHPVEAILQIPDISMGGPLDYSDLSGNPEWEPPIFASTSKDGLWSYRSEEWNTED